MKRIVPVLAVLGMVAVGYVHLRAQPLKAQPTAKAHAKTPARAGGGVKLVRTYRSWQRVNPTPQLMDVATAVMCAAPSPAQPFNPHSMKFITVYVNAVGRHAMLSEATPHFPVGTVIVKEKLPAPTLNISSHNTANNTANDTPPPQQKPELLTVMVKHAPGFNPKNGDWEYLALNGAATQVLAHGQLGNCESCHAGQKSNDYVFRNYLPDRTN